MSLDRGREVQVIADAVQLASAGRRPQTSRVVIDALSGLVTGAIESAGVATMLAGALAELGAVTVSVDRDVLRMGNVTLGGSAAATLRARGITWITVHRPPGFSGCNSFVRALSPLPTGSPLIINENLWSSGFEVGGPKSEGDGRPGRPEFVEARLVADWLYRARRGRVTSVFLLRRAVAATLDAGVPDAGDTEDGPADGMDRVARARRVFRLALRVGSVVGLRRLDLEELGVAAITRDVGALLSRGGEDEQAEEGARALLSGAYSAAAVRRALVALEHGRDFESAPVTPTLFARIVRAADDYDRLVYGAEQSPADALRALSAETGTRYCPIVFQALATALGPMPPGTRLRLVDGRTAVVISYPREEFPLDRPLVQITHQRDGAEATVREVVDLAKEGRVTRVLSR